MQMNYGCNEKKVFDSEKPCRQFYELSVSIVKTCQELNY